MYGKFFASTFTGSMFGAGADVFAVWGWIIANTAESTIEINPSLTGAVLGLSPNRVQKALEYLCAKDPHSRTKELDGRRLVHEGAYQYRVVNHHTYRAIRNEEERRAYNREAQRRSRSKRKDVKDVNPQLVEEKSVNPVNPHVNDMSAPSAHTEIRSRDRNRKRERIKHMKEAPSALTCSQNEIFRHWNAQEELTTHRALSPRLSKALKARLTNGYSLEDLKQAVSRYAELCREECAPGHNHWGLFELVSRGEGAYIDRMLDKSFEGFKTDEQREDAKKRKLREEIRARDAKRAEAGEDDDENY